MVVIGADDAALDVAEAFLGNRLIDPDATEQRPRSLTERVRGPFIVERLIILAGIAIVQIRDNPRARWLAFFFQGGNKPLVERQFELREPAYWTRAVRRENPLCVLAADLQHRRA